MMRHLLAALLALSLPAAASATAFPRHQPMNSIELDSARGGFTLPGGLQINLGVVSETRVDGRLVLTTIFRLGEGRPQIMAIGNGAAAGNPADTAQVILRPGETALATPDGIVSISSLSGGTRVNLQGDGLQVAHLTGQAFGSLLVNSVNDRSIETVTSIDIQLAGITPDLLGSTMGRVNALALESTGRLVP